MDIYLNLSITNALSLRYSVIDLIWIGIKYVQTDWKITAYIRIYPTVLPKGSRGEYQLAEDANDPLM